MASYRSTTSVSITPTITAGAYSAGDVVGGLLTFNVGYPYGTVRSVILVDDAAQDVPLKLYFFNTAPTTIADNAAFSGLAEADYEKFIGSVAISLYDTAVNAAYVQDADVSFSLDSPLFAYLVTDGSTPTYAATDDITVTLILWLD